MFLLSLLSLSLAADRPELAHEQLSATHPIRVHWERPSDDTRANRVLSALELAWDKQVDGLGFRPPLLPDGPDGGRHGPELDAYLLDLGDGQAWASPDNFVDDVPGDGFSGTTAWLGIDQDLPLDDIEPFLAHEFNHVLQYGTDFNEQTLTIWEATAVCAQTWTLGEAGAWDADVADFQADPYLNTLGGDSYFSYYELGVGFFYEYGAALWMMHLDEVVGTGDGSAGPALWEAAAQEGLPNEPDVIEAFAELSGKPIGPALTDLARTRFLVGDDWDDRGLPEARDWPARNKVPAIGLGTEDLPFTQRVLPRLMPTGMAFFDLDLRGVDRPEDPWLVVDATSDRGLRSAVLALTWATDGTVDELADSGEAAFVELPLTGIDRVVVAVINLEEPGWDGDHHVNREGDQDLYLAIADGPGTHEPGSGAPDCGCATGPGAPTWPVLLPLVLLFRREARPSHAGMTGPR